MSLKPNLKRARELMTVLYEAFLPGGPGVFGRHAVSEELVPRNLQPGSREHLIFLTLTVAVDYMRPAGQLWRAARAAYEHPKMKDMFEPQRVYERGREAVGQDLRESGISRKHGRDARAWFNISRALALKWDSDPRRFLESCGWHAPTVLARLKREFYMGEAGPEPDFPLLQGRKIGPLWIRILRDNGGIEFKDMDQIDIAVDVHVLRATICSGALTGTYRGNRNNLLDEVRRVWREAAQKVVRPDGKSMSALDIDEALWTLSQLGCSLRGSGQIGPCLPGCPAAPRCIGGIIDIQGDACTIDVA